ncbi:hypothetical protein [Nocardia pneumoniae]|uniref:hypothetical protein n=1 Tax=Nocardia pneumoniae TaxID=228601 RepID=UPI0002DCE02D|nr:hypothetical protein [Nocardia pneumoniae]
MSKVDDAVDLIDGHYEDSFWGNDQAGFQNDQARESLDALADLKNPDEFEEAFDRLSPTLRETLAETAQRQGLDDDDKYSHIINSLATGDPSVVVNALREPEFDDDSGGWSGLGPDEGEHAQDASLWIPRGASEALKSLIKDTEFTMQWGFDTLGIGNPGAAPDFTTVLDGERVTTADGWSQIIRQHGDLNERLTKRQDEYTGEDGGVKITTLDTEITGSDVFQDLKKIKDNLNERLQFEFPGYVRDGDEIQYSYRDVDNYRTGMVVYKKNEDSGNFVLTAEAEQQYFVKYIDEAAENWERKYAEATEQFQQYADQIDKGNAGDDGGDAGDDGRDTGGDTGGAGGDSGGDGGDTGDDGDSTDPIQDSNFPLPVQGASTTESGSLEEDWSSTYDDLLGGAVDTAGSLDSTSLSGVTPELDSTSGISSGTDPGSRISAALGSGTGSVTGIGTENTSIPASYDNGADVLNQLAMMSALGQMANPGNRLARDDSGHDDRDSREYPQHMGERNGTAPAATTNPAVQTAPTGVTAPTNAGTPPPVTTPGAMVDVPIDNTTVKASQPVAEALQKQVQNVAMDAISTYRGTAGELSADHPPAVINSRDPGAFNTGDILQWERHNALIVKENNQLFVLDNGRLIPFDANKPPLEEKYGMFTGYIHPTGLDGAAGGDPAVAAAPAPPTVSAPQQPAGAPPVSPPQI